MKVNVGVLAAVAFAAWATCEADTLVGYAVDGGWSPWSTVATPCVKELDGYLVPVTCGGGKMIRKRSCSNPTPQGYRSKLCEGRSEMTFDCNTDPCEMQWSMWSDCSVSCGRGFRRRQTMCAATKAGQLRTCKDLGLADQDFEHLQECNTWNLTNCPSPCIGYLCMEYAMCEDVSTVLDPKAQCVCQLGRVMDGGGTRCVYPDHSTPEPRPIPVLDPSVKLVTVLVTRTASAVLIGFLATTLFLFAWLKIYDVARVIQMNAEISLVCAHLCLVIPSMHELNPQICKAVSISIHLFYTVTFVFLMLESLHFYSLVAHVVKKDGGLLNRAQNTMVGWGLSTAVVMVVAALNFRHYGGSYHCWLQVDTPLVVCQVVPMLVLVGLTFAIIEAAGAASSYPCLPGTKGDDKLTSVRVMQRANLIIVPLTLASFIVGFASEYEQNVPLYGTSSVLNGFLGGVVFFFHCTGNEEVRKKLAALYNLLVKKG